MALRELLVFGALDPQVWLSILILIDVFVRDFASPFARWIFAIAGPGALVAFLQIVVDLAAMHLCLIKRQVAASPPCGPAVKIVNHVAALAALRRDEVTWQLACQHGGQP